MQNLGIVFALGYLKREGTRSLAADLVSIYCWYPLVVKQLPDLWLNAHYYFGMGLTGDHASCVSGRQCLVHSRLRGNGL
jgi:hypothetical protein